VTRVVPVVLASRNPGKVREVAAILRTLPIELLALPPDVALPPEGDEYEANALAKARSAARAVDCTSLGDDSGLEVDALGGAPGPRSARWGGGGLDDAARNERLLAVLRGVPAAGRKARFVCVAAFSTPEGDIGVARGVLEGCILGAPRGAGGFGYDPVFGIDGRSLAELPAQEKDAISHRGRAFRALAPRLVAALRARSGGGLP
jgi:XTP/dITP diphosphohydrolase